MVKEIKIKNFKNFEDIEFTNLSPIVFIGGKNNTGKTNLLEALFLFFDINNPACLFKRPLTRNPASFQLTELFSYLNYQLNTKNIISITLKDQDDIDQTINLKTNNTSKKAVFSTAGTVEKIEPVNIQYIKKRYSQEKKNINWNVHCLSVENNKSAPAIKFIQEPQPEKQVHNIEASFSVPMDRAIDINTFEKIYKNSEKKTTFIIFTKYRFYNYKY